jgi:fatty-acyl-CoA synthase
MDTMKDLLLWTESGFGAKEAIVDFDRGVRWSYSQLNDYARRICASYARDGGVTRGDRVGWLSMGPRADILALSFGLRKMGAIPVTMNARASAESVAWMINNVEMKALAYGSDCLELLKQIIAIGIPSVKEFVAIDGAPLGDRHLSLADLYRTYESAPEPDVTIEQDDVALIVYTSGSTGRPKPIMHTEATWAATSMNLAYMWSLYYDDRFLALMPPHFVGWAHVTSATLRAAASQVCLRFDPAAVARAVQQERCTHAIFTPTLIRILFEEYRRDPSRFADNPIRIGMLGGETITNDVLDKLRLMFPLLERTGSFGSSEAASLHTGLRSARAAGDPMVLGKPLPGVTVELRDAETGELVTEPGAPGVLLVKGPTAVGIWNDPEATKKSFPGGWWYSGDVLSRDKDGYMSFTGRSDHMFKSGAIKVFSEEVEEVLKRHPHVLDVIVVPVPDDRFGQVPLAFVRHNATVSGEEFERWWREQDAPGYCRPRYWIMRGTEPFPMVTAAKVDRRALRDLAQQIYQQSKMPTGEQTA